MLSRGDEKPQYFRVRLVHPRAFFPAEAGFFPMSAVLIVDDEPLIRWSVAQSLEAAGYRVAEAATAGEALKYFENGPDGISVVVLDLKLPDSSDLALLRRIHQIAPGCPIILMTAHGSPEILAEAMHSGAYNVLGKPFDLNRVVGMVRQAAAVAH